MTVRRTIAAAIAIATIAALAYLRDPPWLAGVESGLRGWETAADGTRFRWTDGHASFFVPAASGAVTIPVRVPFDAPGDPPVRVRIAIDDRLADEFELRDDRWTSRRLQLPPPGSRSLRRVDLRVDRVRAGNRGVQMARVH
ncbi:MAG TPA: hypothetical protein VFJ02_23310 [Vicinamibacterales bacterium]|nr:hypothetical protein [Vicinamibacterales bacterium]